MSTLTLIADRSTMSGGDLLLGLIDLGFHRAGRLQGAPDGWTDGQADSPRYKQLGNSVAVPVFEWVARRLVEVDAERAA